MDALFLMFISFSFHLLLLVLVFLESSRRRRNIRLNRELQREGCSQPTMPDWEIEFCQVFSSMQWQTFQHKKRFIHGHHKVMQWNDSAGKEAFRNAKNRFWAMKEGLYCDKPIPNPDMFIDHISWDSEEEEDDPRIWPGSIGGLDPWEGYLNDYYAYIEHRNNQN